MLTALLSPCERILNTFIIFLSPNKEFRLIKQDFGAIFKCHRSLSGAQLNRNTV